MIRPDPTGWTVAITHPETGRVHTPDVVGSPSRTPTANALPTVSIPVATDDKWLHPDFERGAEMRVWVDGQLQPLDWLEGVSHSENSTTLDSEGGHELKARTKRDVDQRTTHGLVETLIQGRTPYDPVVTAPPPNREDGVEIANWSEGTILAENCPGVADPREPITVSDDGRALEVQQVAYPQDGVVDEVANAVDAQIARGPEYSGGQAASIREEGDLLRFVFEPDHDIPAEHVGIRIRDQAYGRSNVRYSWAGTPIDEQHNDATDLRWREMGQGRAYSPGRGYQAAVGSALKAGTEYAFDVEVLAGGARYGVDLVALWDTRFSPTIDFPNPGTENDGDTLPGPQRYPGSYRARFSPVEPIRSVVGGRAVVEGRSGGAPGADPERGRIYLSADQADTYARDVGNDVSFEFDQTGPGPSLTAIVAVGREGVDPDRARPPGRGFRPQRIESVRLEADLVDTPITVDRSFDAQLHEILTTLADESDSIWEYRRSGDGPGQVVWTQAGRSPVESQRAPDASSFSLDKNVGTTVETAVVYGGARSVTGERIAANHGTPQGLTHDRIQRGSLSIAHAREGTNYAEGDDYTIDYEQGQVTTRQGNRIDDGAALAVSYSYQTRGEYTSGVSGPSEDVVEDIPGINSNYAAGQAARLIVTERQRDQLSGQLVIPSRDTGFSVVEYLRPEDLPIGQGGRRDATAGLSALHIREITTEPTQTTLRLGNRRSVSEIVAGISSRVSATSRQS